MPGLLFLAIIAAGAFVLLNALWYFESIARYNNLGRIDDQSLQPGRAHRIERRSVFMDIDCQMWNLLAAGIAEGNNIRVRRTAFDNHPFGREVHWSSGYAWLLCAAGWLWKLFSQGNIRTAIEKASIFVNPVLHVVLILLTAAATARKYDWKIGALMAMAMSGSVTILDTFNPGGPDHHSLITAAAFGTVACICFGGAGFVRITMAQDAVSPVGGEVFPEIRQARFWFLLSGLFTGIGFWISAITTTLLLIAVGAAIVASVLFLGIGEIDPEVRQAPELWILWGAIGALVGFLLYLVEYFPRDMALRLEVNNPLYHLALLGGSCLFASVCRCRVRGKLPRAREWFVIAAAIIALAPLPLLVFFGGERFYALKNPMLWRWHEHIAEFLPMSQAKFLKQFGVFSVLWLLAALFLFSRNLSKQRRSCLAFFLAAAFVPLGLTIWQQRWASLLAVTMLVVPLAVVHVSLPPTSNTPRLLKIRWYWIVVSVMVLGQFVFQGTSQLLYAYKLKTGKVGEMQFAMLSLARDVAEQIRTREPNRRIVLLSTPWPTVAICYAGDFRGIASLYWENTAGLRALADILTATKDTEALRLIRERGITHMAFLLSDFNVPIYYYRLYGREASAAAIQGMFGTRLFTGRWPWWIQPIPFQSSVPKFRSGAYFYRVAIFRIDPRIH